MISLGTLQNIGIDYQSAPGGIEIFRRGELIFTPKLRDIIYILSTIKPQLVFAIDAVNLVKLVKHSNDSSENSTKFDGENTQDTSSSEDKIAVCSEANKYAVIAIKVSTNMLIKLWHHYLAHLNEQDLKRLMKISKGLSLIGSLQTLYKLYILNKTH